MVLFFTAAVPLFAACAGVFLLFRLFKRLTRRWAWVPLFAYLVAPLAFLPAFVATSALAVSLVSGDVIHTYVFDGSKGPAVWQVNAVVVWSTEEEGGDELERRRLDIIDLDSGRRIQRHDYVRWWAIPIDVRVLGEGRDFVWLYSAELGLHTRDLYDGRWLHAQKELIGDLEVASRKSFAYDPATRGLFVTTQAGQRRFLDPRSLRLLESGAGREEPNRFVARLDHDLTTPSGRRFELERGPLLRLAAGKLAWEPVGGARFAAGYFLRSASLQAELPGTFFIVDQGSLSRVEEDGRVRWTQPGVLDSSRIAVDYAFTRRGRLCVLQDNRLACFSLDDGSVTWVIR